MSNGAEALAHSYPYDMELGPNAVSRGTAQERRPLVLWSKPNPMPPPSGGGRSQLTWPAASISLLLHTTIAAALLYSPMAETGVAPMPTEVASLEVSLASVVDRSEISTSDAPAGTLPAIAANPGEDIETLAASDRAEDVKTSDTSVDPAPDAEHDNESAAIIDGAAPPLELPAKESTAEKRVAKPHPAKTEVKSLSTPVRPRNPEIRKPPEQKTSTQQDKGRDSAMRRKGGNTATSHSSRDGKSGRASASTGSIMGYAARVRARVASNRPSGAGKRGTAVISFAITSAGGLAYARLARSSGIASLDRAALSAVSRAAPFPKPPAGASSHQLVFSVPFRFH